MSEEPGEVIELKWGSNYPEFRVVKGHVGVQEFLQAVADWYEPEEVHKLGAVHHEYARWLFCGETPFNGAKVLGLYPKVARGRFKVTVAYGDA
jgi:hypothetical protein